MLVHSSRPTSDLLCCPVTVTQILVGPGFFCVVNLSHFVLSLIGQLALHIDGDDNSATSGNPDTTLDTKTASVRSWPKISGKRIYIFSESLTCPVFVCFAFPQRRKTS